MLNGKSVDFGHLAVWARSQEKYLREKILLSANKVQSQDIEEKRVCVSCWQETLVRKNKTKWDLCEALIALHIVMLQILETQVASSIIKQFYWSHKWSSSYRWYGDCQLKASV